MKVGISVEAVNGQFLTLEQFTKQKPPTVMGTQQRKNVSVSTTGCVSLSSPPVHSMAGLINTLNPYNAP